MALTTGERTRSEVLGTMLRAARIRRTLTQLQVAQMIGRDQGYICHLENGKYEEPSAEVLAKLARLYAIPLSELLKAIGYVVLAESQNSPMAVST